MLFKGLPIPFSRAGQTKVLTDEESQPIKEGIGKCVLSLMRPRVTTGWEVLTEKAEKFFSVCGGLCMMTAGDFLNVLFITLQQVDYIKVWMWPCHAPTHQHFWNKATTISQPTRFRASYSQPPPPLYTTSLLILHLYWDPFWSPRAMSPTTRESLHVEPPPGSLLPLSPLPG